MKRDGSLTEVFRQCLIYAGIGVTCAVQPCGLVHSSLGETAVPAGIEIILVRALSAVVVSVTLHRSNANH